MNGKLHLGHGFSFTKASRCLTAVKAQSDPRAIRSRRLLLMSRRVLCHELQRGSRGALIQAEFAARYKKLKG